MSTLRANDIIYLDHNATTPLSMRVRERLPLYFEAWGNPSSIHRAGRAPKMLMRESREKIAQMLGVHPLELVFTSGGSEANNLAIKGVFETFQKPELFARKFRNHYLFSSVEHPSLKRVSEYLKERGARIDTIPVNRGGGIDLVAYESLLSDETALVSTMFANNETGNIFPIREMAEMAHARGALFHADCVQALGKVPFKLPELGVDLASFSAHKFYALKGAGALYVRKGLQIESLIHGGGQERHRRGGTENVPAIASFGAMCELKDEVAARATAMKSLRDHLEFRILAEISDARVTGSVGPRLPNTSSLVIDGVDGETMLMNLDMAGFAVSTGAACSSGSPEPSPVLLAMGLARSEAQSSLRLGLGWGTTAREIDMFVDTLVGVVDRIRQISQIERELYVQP